MELEIKNESNSPIKTIEKIQKSKIYFTINKLTHTLELTTDQIFKIFKNNNNDILEKNIRNKRKYFRERCKL